MKKLIIIEGEGFLVAKKEAEFLSKFNDRIRDARFPENEDLSAELDAYLVANRYRYKPLGAVVFDFRL